jgi:catechol 2,3-dioxygenase-like lactoylglutathione lyase family enzyme
MFSGAHVVVYSKNAEADRAFFRDILGFKSVDASHRKHLSTEQEVLRLCGSQICNL